MLNFRGCGLKYLYELFLFMYVYRQYIYLFFPKILTADVTASCFQISSCLNLEGSLHQHFSTAESLAPWQNKLHSYFIGIMNASSQSAFKIMQYKTFFVKLSLQAAEKPNQNKIQCSVIHKQITPMS